MLRSGMPAKETARWLRVKSGIAAGFVVALTAAAVWFAFLRESVPGSPAQLAAAVAQHAANGHNQPQELEFHAARASDLRQAMKSLDFTPVEPAMMAPMNMRMAGARYTTIEGVMAAQILYLDPKGEPCTLYEVRFVKELARVPSGEHVVDGVRVSVWREKGLLMVLTRPMT